MDEDGCPPWRIRRLSDPGCNVGALIRRPATLQGADSAFPIAKVPMRATLAISLVASLLVATPVLAQLVPQPGQVVDGKVVVKVQVTLSDDAVPYHPLARYGLRLFRSPTDSVVLRTDDSGVLQFSIVAGEYRLVSAEPIDWRGNRYRWSVPITIRPGMPLVDLTPQNAVVVPLVVAGAPGTAVRVAAAESSAPASQPVTLGAPTARAPKDGTLGVVLSLLITGGGQFYAGKPAKGAAHLLMSFAGYAMVVSAASDCSYDDECNTGLAGAGLALALGSWVTSMVGAPGDVREWNAKQGFSVAAARPFVAPGAGGTAQVGVALALPR